LGVCFKLSRLTFSYTLYFPITSSYIFSYIKFFNALKFKNSSSSIKFATNSVNLACHSAH
jgi:hypothetical protein